MARLRGGASSDNNVAAAGIEERDGLLFYVVGQVLFGLNGVG